VGAITVRSLDDDVKERLRIRAARHGRSMEAEVREILTDAVREDRRQNLAEALLGAFGRIGGAELDIPPRTVAEREPPDFTDPAFDALDSPA
jgi:plasmid stability protein